ncbi:MAG: restriction endonuclease subunit M [Candidatus Parcubacteria bacterium]|nr:MAG: restriction endonuclease subunit M [Candidatus Parcubacteria bacterium]
MVQALSTQKKINWKEKNIETFGIDLSFANVPEYQRTKHVHRLHPYLGKFIPQLVEIFLKKFFKPGQIILDPFVGSGTTLIEANLLNMPSVGIELSEFSFLIAKVKTQKYDIRLLKKEILDILNKTKEFSKSMQFNQRALFEERDFEPTQYFRTWYHPRAIKEIYFYRNLIPNYKYQDVLKIILSRAARSSRQIPHYDLARPQKPIKDKYWCIKHKKYCFPIDNAIKFISRYSWDTIKRIEEFDKLRADSPIILLQGDSRKIKLPLGKEIDGIFTSPPYLGLIDYHDQHRYAFDLFNFNEYLEAEIGSPNGKGNNKKEKYKEDIAAVFKNMINYLKSGAKIFIVVNDNHNLYPEIAKECGFKFVDIFHRPVLMRTERDNNKFSESIYYFIYEG